MVINQRIANASQPIIKIYHYHCNHLGTPQELSDDKGDIIWLSYDRAWGGNFDTLYKQQFVDNFAVKENELQPFKFQGQSLDIETGLHYNRFRYYDSYVGMFVQRDPIGLLGGDNVFAYAPNPIMWIDVLGLSRCLPKGFKSYGQFKQFGQATQAGLKKAGFANASMYMQGSSHSGRSFETGRPFDEGRISDFDVAVAQPQLFEKAVKLGFAKGNWSQPIEMNSYMAKALGINDTLLKLSKMSGGRPVNMMIFKDVKSIKDKADGTRIPANCM